MPRMTAYRVVFTVVPATVPRRVMTFLSPTWNHLDAIPFWETLAISSQLQALSGADASATAVMTIFPVAFSRIRTLPFS